MVSSWSEMLLRGFSHADTHSKDSASILRGEESCSIRTTGTPNRSWKRHFHLLKVSGKRILPTAKYRWQMHARSFVFVRVVGQLLYGARMRQLSADSSPQKLQPFSSTNTPRDICVVARSKHYREQALRSLRDANIPVHVFRDPEAGEVSPDQNAVRVSSLHGAKGHEFGSVFVVGFVEGVIPIRSAMDTQTVSSRLLSST